MLTRYREVIVVRQVYPTQYDFGIAAEHYVYGTAGWIEDLRLDSINPISSDNHYFLFKVGMSVICRACIQNVKLVQRIYK